MFPSFFFRKGVEGVCQSPPPPIDNAMKAGKAPFLHLLVFQLDPSLLPP